MKEIKLSIIAVLVSFLAVTGGFALILKSSQEEDLSRELKVSALIDEVGDLKQANDQLYQNDEKNTTRFMNLYVQLSNLNKNFTAGLNNKEQTIGEIQGIQKNLADALNDKEATISSLAQKNQQLKQEIAVSEYSPDIKNILVVGQNMGLTDAMILVSINPATKAITTISIPRDLYYKGRKINELFEFYGIEKLEEAIGQVTGIMPDKYVIFDFSSFVSVIDSFGGIDITVEKDLVDNAYPGPDNTYRKITFLKGLHHMDGETALKYARSRESTTDFDRSFRQQDVMIALFGKIRGLDLVQNMDKVLSVYNGVKDSLKTDLGFFEILADYDQYKDYKINSGNVISNRNFLYDSVSRTGQYILLPVNGSYTAIKSYVSNLVNG